LGWGGGGGEGWTVGEYSYRNARHIRTETLPAEHNP